MDLEFEIGGVGFHPGSPGPDKRCVRIPRRAEAVQNCLLVGGDVVFAERFARLRAKMRGYFPKFRSFKRRLRSTTPQYIDVLHRL